MLEALSNGTTKGTMLLEFRTIGPFGGLTAARATQMVAHLPLTIDELDIWDAKYSFEFWNTLIERVNQFHNLNKLWIDETLVGGEGGGAKSWSAASRDYVH